MKKTLLALAATTFITVAIATSCSSPAEKVQSAETKVNEANANLNEANEEYLADIESYRKETDAKIEANEKSIVEFRAHIANEKKEAKEAYNKKIEKLEQKNSDMKKAMADYKAEGKANWISFKEEFNHDMEEFGAAFKDLTVKNVK